MAGGTAVISAAGGLLGLGLGAGTASGVHAVSDTQSRVLGRMVADTVKLHVCARVVLIDELGDLTALDEGIAGLRTRRDELAKIIRERAMREAFGEESDRLKALAQALKRAVTDLLKRRVALLRSPGVPA